MKRQNSYNLASKNLEEASPKGLFALCRNESTPNIFRGTVPDRARGIDLRTLRSYDYVGGKEISSFYERARKVSKDRRRETWLFNIPGAMPRNSKTSITSGSPKEPEKLSSGQIISKVTGRLDSCNSTGFNDSFNYTKMGHTSNTVHFSNPGPKGLQKKLMKHQ